MDVLVTGRSFWLEQALAREPGSLVPSPLRSAAVSARTGASSTADSLGFGRLSSSSVEAAWWCWS